MQIPRSEHRPSTTTPDRSEHLSAERLRRAVDSIPAMFAYWDADLRCRFANRAYEVWFGVKPESLIGTHIRDLLGPALFALNEPHLAAALRGEAQTFERVIPGADGVKRHSLAVYVPDRVDGTVVGFVAHVSEITQLKVAEAGLMASEQRFRALAECSPFGVCHRAGRGHRSYNNSHWSEIFGLQPQQTLGDEWIEAIHPEDRSALRAQMARSEATDHGFDLEFRVWRADGELRVVQCRQRPLVGEDGFVVTAEDVTDRRVEEQRLRASEAFLDRMGRLANVGGWELDLRTQARTWSGQTWRIFEIDPGVPLTREVIYACFADEDRLRLDAALERTLRDGTPWNMELPFTTVKGGRRWVRTMGDLETELGRPVRLVGAIQDVTDQHRNRSELEGERGLRRQIERNAAELDQLLRERTLMLDVLAHEVRQPLNNASAALQGAAALLEEGHDTAAPMHLARGQAVMGEVLASIDNTLAVASVLVQAGPATRIDADIDSVIEVAVADMPLAQRHRIRVERGDAARTVAMDVGLMRLALRNLLANALKFSPAGSPVTLRLCDSDNPLGLLIEVIDTGPGVDAEVLPRLFSRGASARPTSGRSGLGLFIARRAMELQGGRAELVSNEPGATTLRLTLIAAAEH